MTTVYSMASPSVRARNPDETIQDWCTKMSSPPPSGVMNPKPFSWFHLATRPASGASSPQAPLIRAPLGPVTLYALERPSSSDRTSNSTYKTWRQRTHTHGMSMLRDMA